MRKKPLIVLLLTLSAVCCISPRIPAIPVGIGIGGGVLFPIEGTGISGGSDGSDSSDGSADDLYRNGFSVFVDGAFRVSDNFTLYAGAGLDAIRVDIPDRILLLSIPILYAGAAYVWPVSPSMSVCAGADAGICRLLFENVEAAGFRAAARISLEAVGVSGAVTLVPFAGASFYWDTGEWNPLFPAVSAGMEIRFNIEAE